MALKNLKFKNHLNPFPMDKILLGQSLKQVLKALEINLMPGRLLFQCVLLESFKNFPANTYCEPLSWFMMPTNIY